VVREILVSPLRRIIGGPVGRSSLPMEALPVVFVITVLVALVGGVLLLVWALVARDLDGAIFIALLLRAIVVHHILINRK